MTWGFFPPPVRMEPGRYGPGPGYAPYFDGRHSWNLTTDPSLNNLLNANNFIEDQVIREGYMMGMPGMGGNHPILAYANNMINPMMHQLGQSHRQFMYGLQGGQGAPPGVQGTYGPPGMHGGYQAPPGMQGGPQGNYGHAPAASTGSKLAKGAKHALGGVALGAMIGSVVPGIGTALGAAAGGILGFISGLF